MSDLYFKATTYLESGDIGRAEKFYHKLLKICPTHPEANLNMGAIAKGRFDFNTALRYFKVALENSPKWPYVYNNIGLVYHNLNKEEVARTWFEKALAFDSEYGDAHWNLALSLLKSGYSTDDFSLVERGWNEYNWRFKKSNPVLLSVVPALPLGNKGRCLVVAEQGFGDAIMMSRFVDSNMVVYSDGRFDSLFSAMGIPFTGSVEGFDSWMPMMSLAAGRGYGTVEGRWTGGSGIGLCWAGNKDHANDKNRSKLESDFYWLGDVVNLQFGSNSRRFGTCVSNSWSDTIDALLKLRCLVTVDTSLAHLAGWLGVPTCVLVPTIDTDFRWGLNRKDSGWYPSVTVARSMKEVKEYVSSISS